MRLLPAAATFLLALSCAAPVRAQEDLSPEAYFGFSVGADGKLARYLKIVAYLRALEAASPLVRVESLGRTSLGLEHVMAVITSPSNHYQSTRIQSIAASLLDARITSAEAARALAAEGKVAVMICCGIHSDEVASPQTALEIAHDLVMDRDLPFDRGRVLRDVVLLLVPSVNPDGQEMVADWSERTVGTADEGAPMPKLYHVFAGHDDNRDWFAMNLVETRNISNVLYRTWRPQVLVDHHQMGSRGARFFVPPYGDPLNPAVHPLVWRGANLFGQAIAFELESAGKKGVIHDAYYQGWWQGGLSRAPWFHHGIGILTESASAALAQPMHLDEGELETSSSVPSIHEPLSKHPSPWPGGAWRVRDICDYQRLATWAVLRLASERREEILRNVHRMASDSIETGRQGEPYAFVFPDPQRDPAARDRLLEMLRLGGVEVRVASEPFTVEGRVFGAGTSLVALDQPFGPYAKNLLEDQRYPDIAGASRPYDIVGWTLWRMMGVECVAVEKPFALPANDVASERIVSRPRFSAGGGGARWFAVDPRSNDAFVAARRVIAQPKTLRRSEVAIALEDGRTFPPGAFLVEAADLAAGHEWLTEGLAVDVAAVAGEPPAGSTWRVAGPRIGIYEAWSPSMDKGWTMLVVDRWVWKPQLLHDDELAKFLPHLDAFVIPESDPSTLWDGGSRSKDQLGRVAFPKEYRGGIGEGGVKELRAFVERGGTLVALGSSCDFLIERMDLPVSNALKSVARDEFSCPGSLVRLRSDPSHPLAFGMPEEGAAFVSSSVAFRTSPANARYTRSIAARYPDDGALLLSGWLVGADKLQGRAAAVEIGLGEGRIVLLGLRAQHRAQTDGTFKLLFNALLRASSTKEGE